MPDQQEPREISTGRPPPTAPHNARRAFDYLSDELRIPSTGTRIAIPPADLCDRLRSAVETAASNDAASMDSLKATVCEYAALLRDMGSSPEGVLISLKAVMNLQGMPARTRDPADQGRYRLREQISTWCIEEYFSSERR